MYDFKLIWDIAKLFTYGLDIDSFLGMFKWFTLLFDEA